MAVAEVSQALRAHYADYYGVPSAWRTAGAADKVANVLRLCGGLGCESVLEIGSGAGAVLAGSWPSGASGGAASGSSSRPPRWRRRASAAWRRPRPA